MILDFSFTDKTSTFACMRISMLSTPSLKKLNTAHFLFLHKIFVSPKAVRPTNIYWWGIRIEMSKFQFLEYVLNCRDPHLFIDILMLYFNLCFTKLSSRYRLEQSSSDINDTSKIPVGLVWHIL